MNRRNGFVYFGLPIFYVGILLFLILLQFSGGSLFSDSMGPLSLSGVFALSDTQEQDSISSLNLEFQGLRLTFDQDRQLLLSGQQGSHDAFQLLGYQKTSRGFDLFFEDDVVIVTVHDEEAGQFIITPRIPSNLGVYRTISLPFDVVGGGVYGLTEGFPGLDITFRGSRYILSLPPRSIVQQEEKRLLISSDGVVQDIRFTQRKSGEEDIFDLWFQNLVEPVELTEYRGVIQQFIDTAYLGWRGGRFDTGNRVWSHRNGPSDFSEEIMISLLAEAWQRNEYPRTFTEMRLTADVHRNNLTYRSASYLGGLRQITTTIEPTLRPAVTNLSNLLAVRSADVFTQKGLFGLATNHGTQQIVNSLVQFTQGVDPLLLTQAQARGLLINLYVYPVTLSAVETLRETFFPLVEKYILPNITRADEGFFYQIENGVVESMDSLMVGLLLQNAGEIHGDPRLSNLGRHLVVSVLKLSDGLGFIPERIELTGGAISAFNRHIGPEDIYPFITENPHYPREISLYSYFGAGSFYYTIAPVTNISLENNRIIFTLENTPGRTHYKIIRGLPPIDPLSGMELFNITYRDAADFEIYSRGRYYNPASRTLMVKYFDDNPNGRIIVYQ